MLREAVNLYLEQIGRHNHRGMKLIAMIRIALVDTFKSRAESLEQGRRTREIRGRLHGVPVIVKVRPYTCDVETDVIKHTQDNICTPSLSMHTTLGALAFENYRGLRNAVVVDRLLEAGTIIIGKTNLSELGSMKGEALTGGWSPVGGQTPMGSSSGSAVGVAAGFRPLGVGTETDGSVVQPAARASLYAMKMTCEIVPLSGMQRAAPSMDSPGGLAKSSKDLADLISIMGGNETLGAPLSGMWDGIRVGLVNSQPWRLPGSILEPIELVKNESVGATCHLGQPFSLTSVDRGLEEGLFNSSVRSREIMAADIADTNVAAHEVQAAFEGFMREDLIDLQVKTLEEMMEFNVQHADVELPPDILISIEYSTALTWASYS
nr:glutamyl-trna(gln) amidotransferase subunit a [Quercus suber]